MTKKQKKKHFARYLRNFYKNKSNKEITKVLRDKKDRV